MTATITQTFSPAIGEYGQDYAVPTGTPIYSPVSGTFSSVDNGKKAWGKQAFVHLSQAVGGVATFSVGHLTSFAKQPGQHVNAGDLIGYSGGALSDPSSGVSTGPHVEPQFYNPKGQPINPTSVFAQFASWEKAIFSPTPQLAGAAASNPSTSSSGGFDPFGFLQNLIIGGAQTVSNPGAAVAAAVLGPLTRAFWILIGIGLFMLGIAMVFFNDLEHAIEGGKDVAEKAGEAAATVAAPEAAIPAIAAKDAA